MMIRRLILLIAVVAFAGAAFAADSVGSISNVQGSVMFSHGGQFVPADKGQALPAGDRVMVAEGGSAMFVFNDGCKMPIAGGTIVTIPETSTCAGADVASQETPRVTNTGDFREPSDWSELWLVLVPVVVLEYFANTVTP